MSCNVIAPVERNRRPTLCALRAFTYTAYRAIASELIAAINSGPLIREPAVALAPVIVPPITLTPDRHIPVIYDQRGRDSFRGRSLSNLGLEIYHLFYA